MLRWNISTNKCMLVYCHAQLCHTIIKSASMVCFILNTLSNNCNRVEIIMLFHYVFIWFYSLFICTKIRISSDCSVPVGEHYSLFKLHVIVHAVQSAVTSEFSRLFLSSLVTLTQNPWNDKLTYLGQKINLVFRATVLNTLGRVGSVIF